MVLVALILAAAAPADAVPKARQAYAGCLADHTQDAKDRKMARSDFAAGLKTKCAKKEAEFRTVLIAQDKVDGMSDAEAQEDANDQIAGYISDMTEEFDSQE